MSQFSDSQSESLIPQQTAPTGFEGMDAMFEMIAVDLYNMASMLVGEGEDSIGLVETAVATAEIPASDDAREARQSSRLALARAAVELLAKRTPGCLDAPSGVEHVSTCIGDDDLDAASESGAELERMMAGPDRGRVREWLGSLPTEHRVIFVLRAVAGFSSAETASLLVQNGGAGAAGWNAEPVREIFRQALCSLASQLLHASTAH